MKHKIENIDSAAWLNIVNSEAHPDAQTYDLKHYRIGNGIMSVLISGVGRIQTPLYSPADKLSTKEMDALLEQNIKDIEVEHKRKMDMYGFSIGKTKEDKTVAENKNNNPNAFRSPFSPF